jgi:protein-tyrosine-phosphatase
MNEPLRVLFLCTQNSARSQIAEALLRRKGAGRFHVTSAGTEPASAVHPLTMAVLLRAGIDWEGRRPRSIEAVMGGEAWDLVITVCDRARETCPRLPGQPVTAHWGIADPAAVSGSDAAADAAFWEALTFLSRRIDLLCALPDEKLRGLALESSISGLLAETDAATERRPE